MEQEINQQQFNQSELKNRDKVKNLFFVGTLCSFLVVLIVASIYFILNNSYSKKQNKLNNQISVLQDQVNILKQQKEIAEPQNTNNQNSINRQTTLVKIKEDDRFVFYSGSITVSGKYEELYPEGLLGGELCFYPDNETGYLIPRDSSLWGQGNGDTRTPWFCFKNQDKAKEMFDINDNKIFGNKTIECIQGKATIEVSNYIVDKAESEVFDTADLNKIISKENYSTPCE